MTTKAVHPFNWTLVIGFWMVVCVLLLARSLITADGQPLYGDTDDAMRIVTMTQVLDGQDWRDHSLSRDNTPYGTQIHWSRLVDAPIAALVLLAKPLAGAGAVDIAARIWPLLLLLPLLVLGVALVRRLVPAADTVTGLVLPILSIVLLAEFFPGRVDHHNIQIILALGMALAAIESRSRPPVALLCGLLAATSLAIGMETLPFVVLTITTYAIFWVEAPARHEVATRWFALSFALGTLAHFLFAVAPALYLQGACDTISLTYVTASAGAGTALAAATYLGRNIRGPWARLLLIAGLGALAGAATLVLFPACAGGPYAQINGELYARLFPSILEAQPLWTRFMGAPAIGLGLGGTALVSVLIAAWIFARSSGEARANWLVLLAFLVVAVLIMVLQVRGSRLAAVFTVPVGAWVITGARQNYLAGRSPLALAGLVGSWLIFASAVQWVALDYGLSLLARPLAPNPALAGAPGEEGPQKESNCYIGSAYSELAALPAARLMTPLRLGPYVLRYTSHSIVGDGFHRNSAGTLEVLNFFSGSAAEAQAIVKKRGLDYLVTCDGLAELNGDDGAVAGSFVDLHRRGERWDWLEPVPVHASGLAVYRFLPTKADTLN